MQNLLHARMCMWVSKNSSHAAFAWATSMGQAVAIGDMERLGLQQQGSFERVINHIHHALQRGKLGEGEGRSPV